MNTKNNLYLFSFFLALLFFPQGAVHADVSSILYIQGPGGSILMNTSVVVPSICTVQDSAGTSHTFSGHKAPCALQASKNAGLISSFVFKNFEGLGLFLDSINGIASGPAPDYPFWNLWKNGTVSEAGIQGIVLSSGDTFQLAYGPWVTGIVQQTKDTKAGGPLVLGPLPTKFDIENAVLFLVKNQNEDGSFKSSSLLTDWVGIALGAYEGYSATAKTAVHKLREYLAQDPNAGTSLTDKIRRAMALEALGISPYEGTKTNYIAQIVKEFDGTQFGNPNLVNDDMFALLVLRKAGYGQTEEMIQKARDFVFSWQKEEGSWGTVDMTGAALQALTVAGASRDERLLHARGYILSQEKEPNSFGNVYSTSWALQGLAALGEKKDTSWLALRQALDGGLEQGDSVENRIWATSYAIPAALGKDWGKILVEFRKPQELELEPVLQVEQGTLDPALAKEIQFQLDVVAQETKILTLEVVELELQEITAKVAALEPRVLAFVESRESAFVFAPQAQPLDQIREELLTSTAPLVHEEFSASVSAAGIPWRAVFPYAVAGGVLAFLLFGNPNFILSFLRGKLKLTP